MRKPRKPAPRRITPDDSPRVPIRLSREELAELDAAAQRDGIDRSTWIREAALARARGGGIEIPRATADVIRELARARGVSVEDLAGLVAAAVAGWPARVG